MPFKVCHIVLVGAFLGIAAAASGQPAKMPWALRDHFTINQGKYEVDFAVDNAEWRVVADGVGPLVSSAEFRIVLADGTVITPKDFSPGEGRREKAGNPLGSCNYFITTLKSAKYGLTVSCRMAHYAIRPFCTIHMEITNTGVKPVAIKSLSPMWLAAGGMVKVAETTNCHIRRGTLRGGSLTFDAEGAPMLALLDDPGSAVTVAVGALREGETESAGRFSTDPGGWGGEISSSYSPPCELKPGNTLCADPVGIFLSQDGMEAVENAYLWAQYQFCQAPVASGAPSYWVTVGETETADELLRAARAWAGSVAAHVLVPASWQVPDSTYPGDMRLFADQIVKAGMVPGIAIDPLRAGKGLSGPHIAAGPDGALWINPAAAKGRAAAADQVHAAVEWGYRFFVLRNSDMPDTVLSQFGLTRGQADKMALDILRDNGGDRPILAASTATLNADTRAWEAAAQSVAGVQAYGLSPGAVRIDMAEVKDISDELVQAMAAYEGPIEIVGRPVGKAKRQLAEVVMAQRKYKANASGIRAAQAEKKSR